jgi:endogenous inhibitor of DNA gyrase (YacG/DUF329 family)
LVSGRFQGIQGNQAKIGGRRVLLDDIVDTDRKRLEYGDNVQLLQMRINRLSKELADEKRMRADILREARYKEAGYTKRFFGSTIRAAGRFWSRRDLGDRRFSIKVERSENSQYLSLEFDNDVKVEAEGVLFYRSTPVMSSTEAQRNSRGQWASGEFKLPLAMLGDDPFAALKRNLVVRLHLEDVAHWQLAPKTLTRVIKDREFDVPCPECGGRKVTPTIIDGEPAERPCPTCEARGAVRVDEFVVSRTKLIYALDEKSIEEYSDKSQEEFEAHQESAASFQREVVEAEQTERDKVRAARETAEKEAAEEHAAEEQAAEERKKRKRRIVKAEASHPWWTPNEARDKEPRLRADDTATQAVFDDIAFPTMLDDDTVEKFTMWTAFNALDRRVYGRKHRLLKVVDGDGNISFHFQYQLSSLPKVASPFEVEVEVKYRNGTVDKWSDVYELPSAWRGQRFVGHREIDIDRLEAGIDVVSVTVTKGFAEDRKISRPTGPSLATKSGKAKPAVDSEQPTQQRPKKKKKKKGRPF